MELHGVEIVKLTKDEEREVISVRDRISNLTDEIIEIDDEIVKLLTVEIATLTKKRAILENEQNILISRDVEICFHAGSKFKKKAKALLDKLEEKP